MLGEKDDAAAETVARVGFDRSAIADSVQQAFDPKPLIWGSGPDGLPTPELNMRLPLVAPLAPETFVCLADESEFVLRSKRWGEIVARFKPGLVERAPNGKRYVSLESALLAGAPLSEIWRALDLRRGRVAVEPIRPPCSFLAQQMVDFGADNEHQNLERLCTARRDEDSFFVGLQNTQVHACELRSPRDDASEKRIRLMNETKIRLGRERMKETGESFNVDDALAGARDHAERDGLTTTNIFK